MGERLHGFPPFFDGNSEILVLGSFPSVKSREEGFYYGNRQNRLWKTLARAFCLPEPATVPDKKALLARTRVALWDMVTDCEIEGSMDKDLRAVAVADLSVVLSACNIRKILCNGKTAYTLFAARYPALTALRMPSTSPANPRYDYAVWENALLG